MQRWLLRGCLTIVNAVQKSSWRQFLAGCCSEDSAASPAMAASSGPGASIFIGAPPLARYRMLRWVVSGAVEILRRPHQIDKNIIREYKFDRCARGNVAGDQNTTARPLRC